MEMSVSGQNSGWTYICVLRVSILHFPSLYDFSVGFWNCSDSGILLVSNELDIHSSPILMLSHLHIKDHCCRLYRVANNHLWAIPM